MEIKNDDLGYSFHLPERLTVRQQLQIRSGLGPGFLYENVDYARLWKVSLPYLENWQCALIPDPEKVDLDTETNPQVADIVSSVGMAVFMHSRKQADVEKN